MKTLLLTLLTLPLIAAEGDLLVDYDVRLTLSAMPKNYDSTATLTQTGEKFTQSGTIDSGTWTALDMQASLREGGKFAVLVGGGIDFIGLEDGDAEGKDSLRGVGLHVDVGGSFRPTPMFSMELSLLLGGGSTSYTAEDTADNISVDSSSGTYGTAAILFRPVITFKPGFQLFGQIGYSGFNFKNSFDETATTVPFKIETDVSGITYGLGIGWRF